MWFWNNKNKRPVWHKENGEIDCPGDSCMKKCDQTCPIWCHTMAVELIRTKRWFDALDWDKKAVDLAPDYAEAWNNLGVVYGHFSIHQKAYESFKKALEIRHDYLEAINGVNVAEKHLSYHKVNENKSENERPKRHLNLIGIGGIGINDLDNRLIVDAKEKNLSSGENIDDDYMYTKEDAQEVLHKAIACAKEAYTKQIFPIPTLPNVPELMVYLDTVPYAILEYVDTLFPKELKQFEFIKVIGVLKWSFYLGIGAVQQWHLHWNELKGKDLLEVLNCKTTFEDLDKNVINMTYGSKAEEDVEVIDGKLRSIYLITSTKFGMTANGDKLHLKMLPELDMVKISQVTYLLGCAYRLHELGMH